MADFDIGSTSGLGGFATALPGAIDEWIRQNEQQRQVEQQGRYTAAIQPFQEEMIKSQAQSAKIGVQMEAAKASYMSQAMAGLTGGQPGRPMSEMERGILGLKGRDPQVILQEKMFLEDMKQSGMLARGKELIGAREESTRRLQGERQEAAKKQPTLSQVMGGILQAKIDGKITPQQDAAWRMAKPVETHVLDKVEQQLKGNQAYQLAVLSGDMPTANKIRDDLMNQMMTFYGMNPAASHEEVGASEEPLSSEEEAQAGLIAKAAEMAGIILFPGAK